MRKSVILLVALVCAVMVAQGRDMEALRRTITAITDSAPGRIGIAMIADGDTLVVNGSDRFPMMSVFKLHQAIAVAEALRRRGEDFSHSIHVEADELDPDTWSPDLKKYVGKPFDITVGQLIEYSLIDSDNNASNLMFKHLASPEEVDMAVRALTGIRDFNITWTEGEMKRDPSTSYDNWSSPLSGAALIQRVFTTALTELAMQEFIKDCLRRVNTGTDRLAAVTADHPDVGLAHKTGSGYRTPDGILTAYNDVGYFNLPDGRAYALAVFIRDYAGPDTRAAAAIAAISRAIHKFQQTEK